MNVNRRSSSPLLQVGWVIGAVFESVGIFECASFFEEGSRWLEEHRKQIWKLFEKVDCIVFEAAIFYYSWVPI